MIVFENKKIYPKTTIVKIQLSAISFTSTSHQYCLSARQNSNKIDLNHFDFNDNVKIQTGDFFI